MCQAYILTDFILTICSFILIITHSHYNCEMHTVISILQKARYTVRGLCNLLEVRSTFELRPSGCKVCAFGVQARPLNLAILFFLVFPTACKQSTRNHPEAVIPGLIGMFFASKPTSKFTVRISSMIKLSLDLIF